MSVMLAAEGCLGRNIAVNLKPHTGCQVSKGYTALPNLKKKEKKCENK